MITYSEFALLATPITDPEYKAVSLKFHPDGTEIDTIPSALVTVTIAGVAVVVVVAVIVVEAVVVAVVVVAVVDALQDAKAIDATKRKLRSAPMIPFFMHTSLCFTILPHFMCFNG